MTRWKLTAVAVGFVGLVGVALADPPENSFAGSWAGTFFSPDLDTGGTQEWTISNTGLLRGSAVNPDAELTFELVGLVKDDGTIHFVVMTEKSSATVVSGAVAIDQYGNMVGTLTACGEGFCYNVVVEMAPVVADGVAAIEEIDDVAESDPDAERFADSEGSTDLAVASPQSGACNDGSYVGGIFGWGYSPIKAEAQQQAKDSAQYSCDVFCAGLDACSSTKPTCEGHARVNSLSCSCPKHCQQYGCGGTGDNYGCSCSGEYTCTCACAGN